MPNSYEDRETCNVDASTCAWTDLGGTISDKERGLLTKATEKKQLVTTTKNDAPRPNAAPPNP